MIAWCVRFAIEAMFPPIDGLPGVADAGSAEFVPKLLSEASWLFWVGVVASSIAFILLPVLTIYWPVPAVFLSADRLDDHADRWATHPLYLIRQSGFLIKLAAGLCWGLDPAVRQHFAMAPFPPDPGTWRTS